MGIFHKIEALDYNKKFDSLCTLINGNGFLSPNRLQESKIMVYSVKFPMKRSRRPPLHILVIFAWCSAYEIAKFCTTE